MQSEFLGQNLFIVYPQRYVNLCKLFTKYANLCINTFNIVPTELKKKETSMQIYAN